MLISVYQGMPSVRKLPDTATLKRWGHDQKRDWLNKEINEFLKAYVFTQTSEQLVEFVAAVEELDTQQRHGYPCRECGMLFTTHPTRVKYVVYITLNPINSNILSLLFPLYVLGLMFLFF